MIEVKLARDVDVGKAFDYFAKQLGAKCTMYGGTAFDATIRSDTFLGIIGTAKDGEGLEHTYSVNPHAGFATVEGQRSRHFTVIPIKGRDISHDEVRILREELAGLR